MIIGQIKDGIVLDHITAGKAMDIYNILKLGKLDCTVAMIKNAESEKMDLDLDLLGFIAPQITVNVIENGEKVDKIHPALPEKLTNVIRCRNPRCITSIEQELPHIFRLTDAESGTYRCIYCDTKA